MQSYHTKRDGPITPEELEEKQKEIQEEWEEVNNWEKEEKDKLKKDKFKTHQAKSACKRNLFKAKRRVNSVKGTVAYWKNRKEGMSHFRASIELNEYWASLKEKENEEKRLENLKFEKEAASKGVSRIVERGKKRLPKLLRKE